MILWEQIFLSNQKRVFQSLIKFILHRREKEMENKMKSCKEKKREMGEKISKAHFNDS